MDSKITDEQYAELMNIVKLKRLEIDCDNKHIFKSTNLQKFWREEDEFGYESYPLIVDDDTIVIWRLLIESCDDKGYLEKIWKTCKPSDYNTVECHGEHCRKCSINEWCISCHDWPEERDLLAKEIEMKRIPKNSILEIVKEVYKRQ